MPRANGELATESFQEAQGALVDGKLLQIVGGPNPESNFVLAASGKATSTEVGFQFKLAPKTGLFSGTQPSSLIGGKPKGAPCCPAGAGLRSRLAHVPRPRSPHPPHH